MIRIVITGSTPLEALSAMTALAMRCMENKEVFDAAVELPTPGALPPEPNGKPAPTTGTHAAPASAYTLEQISKAGADLIADSAKLPELQNLLRQFGVEAVAQLSPDRYGDFAAALRGLGASF